MLKSLAVSLLLILPAFTILVRAQDDASFQPFSPDQLDNLLAPVALYPDPLLAQILIAATFPDQVDEAARFCRGGASPDDIDTQPWDVSVKAVAHYQTVLYTMADSLDWTTAMGQAYVNQSGDVMASIQRLRQEARRAGNLATTPQQDVEFDDSDIEIWPAQGQYCYLPVYDPGLAFFGSGGVFGGPVITFSAPFPIGAWLNYDFDWRHHRIYYHGWSAGRGWIARSRPYVQINNVYVNKSLKEVSVDRSVTARPVNYGNLTRYNTVHRDTPYGHLREEAGTDPTNKIIERNAGAGDSRIDQYRGRAPEQPAAGRAEPAQTSNPAFGASRGSFNAKASSQRGQTSRAQAARSAPAKSSGGGSHGGGGGGGSHGGGGGGGSHGGGGGRH